MNKPNAKFAASVGLIATALAVTFFLPQSRSAVIDNSEVYTWDCEYAETKPEAITFTCGDGGQYVDSISWKSWGKDGALGTGTYHVNNCDPSCAEGDFLSTPVEIRLTNLTKYKGLNYLRTLNLKTLNGENLPDSSESTYEWDVMEFAEMMAE